MALPILRHFSEALQSPGQSFVTLAECRPARNQTGEVVMSRSSRFAEATVRWQGADYLLCFPLSPSSIESIESFAANPASDRSENTPLTEYKILRNEMRFDGAHSCDVVLQRLPQGKPLTQAVYDYSGDTLIAALDALETELSRIGFAHNNLKPENLIVTSYGQIVPIRYHFAAWGRGTDAEAFELIRDFIHAHAGSEALEQAQVLQDVTFAAYDTGAFKELGQIRDQLRFFMNREGRCGFLDIDYNEVIPPVYSSASDFCEGRAVVENFQQKSGVIDKQGNVIIPVEYDMAEFIPETGCTRVKNNDMWALFDYDGRVVRDFQPEYINENTNE